MGHTVFVRKTQAVGLKNSALRSQVTQLDSKNSLNKQACSNLTIKNKQELIEELTKIDLPSG